MDDVFPAIDEIDDSRLSEQVETIWSTVMADSEFERIEDVPNFPADRTEGIGDQNLAEHIRWTTRVSIAAADALTEIGDIDIDYDVLIAGSLLHDISKPFEHDSQGMESEIGEKFPHPHYSGVILGETDVPLDVQHIAMSHSPYSSVEPQTLEGAIVQLSDLIAANAYYSTGSNELFVY